MSRSFRTCTYGSRSSSCLKRTVTTRGRHVTSKFTTRWSHDGACPCHAYNTLCVIKNTFWVIARGEEVAGATSTQRLQASERPKGERERERERESFVRSESTTSSPARGGRFWGGFRLMTWREGQQHTCVSEDSA